MRLPRTRQVTTPLLVLQADDDDAHVRKEICATARAYRTKAEFFLDTGHEMTLEPGWVAVAERIHTWLGSVLGEAVAAVMDFAALEVFIEHRAVDDGEFAAEAAQEGRRITVDQFVRPG